MIITTTVTLNEVHPCEAKTLTTRLNHYMPPGILPASHSPGDLLNAVAAHIGKQITADLQERLTAHALELTPSDRYTLKQLRYMLSYCIRSGTPIYVGKNDSDLIECIDKLLRRAGDDLCGL